MDDILSKFHLAPGVTLIAFENLGAYDRQRIDCTPGDVVVSHARARGGSKIVSADAAAFLDEFTQATTIIDAVRRFAAQSDLSADGTLEEVFPLVRNLLNQGFLVRDETDQTRVDDPRKAGLRAGDSFGDYVLRDCIQSFEDVEVYQCIATDGTRFALKIVTSRDRKDASIRVRREADLLAQVNGHPGPTLVDFGMAEGRAYLVLEWLPGEVASIFADRRRRVGPEGRNEISDACVAIVEAFALLHEQSVVHGDVHPKNILIDADGTVRVLDFGLSRVIGHRGALGRSRRGGVPFFFEPEYATARIASHRQSRSTKESDQYGLGCVLYSLLTGHSYIDFSYEKEKMYDQIATCPPRTFADCGVFGLPSVESVIARMLAKSPKGRFASLKMAAIELRAAASQDAARSAVSLVHITSRDTVDASISLSLFVREIVERVLEFEPIDLGRVPISPKCSVHSGASGVAYCLYRIATNTDDATLLAAADRWSHAALDQRGRSDAYLSATDGVTLKTVGTGSVFHGPIGSWFVHALIGQATGDFVTVNESLIALAGELNACTYDPDYFLGSAGRLHVCSTLLATLADEVSFAVLEPLVTHGQSLADALLQELSLHSSIGGSTSIRKLGIAHGWAGLLFVLLRWAEATSTDLPSVVLDRLDELAELAESTGNGSDLEGCRWPVALVSSSRSPRYMGGWCNGTAGHLQLWAAAARLVQKTRYVEVANRTAAEVLRSARLDPNPFLCCGASGAAYALLALSESTNKQVLVDGAFLLAEQAAQQVMLPQFPAMSLYRGPLGVAVLASDLRRSTAASMPMFGPEHPR